MDEKKNPGKKVCFFFPKGKYNNISKQNVSFTYEKTSDSLKKKKKKKFFHIREKINPERFFFPLGKEMLVFSDEAQNSFHTLRNKFLEKTYVQFFSQE